ncbi:hypothetical protein AQJ64_28505 [Streptomyces griseoruber]|uniref:Uncharacterized protein n=1 Tax=Streptomyces griseoruber TaxID=1943 RepID=A0A101ST06_9ACTN|nr:hypothetical protein AQJ64_28505 [Streptomyces griseoruber]
MEVSSGERGRGCGWVWGVIGRSWLGGGATFDGGGAAVGGGEREEAVVGGRGEEAVVGGVRPGIAGRAAGWARWVGPW